MFLMFLWKSKQKQYHEKIFINCGVHLRYAVRTGWDVPAATRRNRLQRTDSRSTAAYPLRHLPGDQRPEPATEVTPPEGGSPDGSISQ